MTTLIALCFFLCSSLFALEVELSGRVLNQDNFPIAFVEIEIPELGLKDTTDSNGDWAIVQSLEDPEPVEPLLQSSFQFQNGRLSGWSKEAEELLITVLDLRGSVLRKLNYSTQPGPWSWNLGRELESLGEKLLLIKIGLGDQSAVIRSHGSLVLSGSVLPQRSLNVEGAVAKLLYKLQGELITEDELTQFKDHIEKYLVERNIQGQIFPDSLNRGFEVHKVQARFAGGKSDREVVARLGYSAQNNRYSGKIYAVKSLDDSVYQFNVRVEVLDSLSHKIAFSEKYLFDSFFGDLELPDFMLGNALPRATVTFGDSANSPGATLQADFNLVDDFEGAVVIWELRDFNDSVFVPLTEKSFEFQLPDTVANPYQFELRLIDNDSNVVVYEYNYMGMVQGMPTGSIVTDSLEFTPNDFIRLKLSFADSEGELVEVKYAIGDTLNWISLTAEQVMAGEAEVTGVTPPETGSFGLHLRVTDDYGNTFPVDLFNHVNVLDEPVAKEGFETGIEISEGPYLVGKNISFFPQVYREKGENDFSYGWKVVPFGLTAEEEVAIPFVQGASFDYTPSVVGKEVAILTVAFEESFAKEFRQEILVDSEDALILAQDSALVGVDYVISASDAEGVLSVAVDWGDGSDSIYGAAEVISHSYDTAKATYYDPNSNESYPVKVTVVDSSLDSTTRTFDLLVLPVFSFWGQLTNQENNPVYFDTMVIAGLDIEPYRTSDHNFWYHSKTIKPEEIPVPLVFQFYEEGQLRASFEHTYPDVAENKVQSFNVQDTLTNRDSLTQNGTLLSTASIDSVIVEYRLYGTEQIQTSTATYNAVTGLVTDFLWMNPPAGMTNYEYRIVGFDAEQKITTLGEWVLVDVSLQNEVLSLSALQIGNALPSIEFYPNKLGPLINTQLKLLFNYQDRDSESPAKIFCVWQGDTLWHEGKRDEFVLTMPSTGGTYEVVLGGVDPQGNWQSFSKNIRVNNSNEELYYLPKGKSDTTLFVLGDSLIVRSRKSNYEVTWGDSAETESFANEYASHYYSEYGKYKVFVETATFNGVSNTYADTVMIHVEPLVQGTIILEAPEGFDFVNPKISLRYPSIISPAKVILEKQVVADTLGLDFVDSSYFWMNGLSSKIQVEIEQGKVAGIYSYDHSKTPEENKEEFAVYTVQKSDKSPLLASLTQAERDQVAMIEAEINRGPVYDFTWKKELSAGEGDTITSITGFYQYPVAASSYLDTLSLNLYDEGGALISSSQKVVTAYGEHDKVIDPVF